ncbi:MAG: hypothetical protein ACL93V_16795 [Candidatus Electrothrix sp. YB6]
MKSTKTTSKVFRRSFISAAAVLFAVPFTAQAGDFTEVSAEVLDAQCVYGTTVLCDYTIRINDDPALSHLNLELPEGAVATSDQPVVIGEDGSMKGTDYADTVYVKWDSGQEVGEENITTYTVEFDNVPEGAGDGWTCEMGFKAARLYNVTEVPGPCRPGPDVADEPTLQVEIVKDGFQVAADGPEEENKSAELIAGQHTDVGSVSVDLEDLDNDGVVDTLSVTYDTEDGWYLQETHLWVENQENPVMPANKKGNPKIGNFPDISEDVYDVTNRIKIPLDEFGDLEGMLCESGMSVNLDAEMAAHASVLHDSLGQETAWAKGDQIAVKGSWAMKTTIRFTCD